MLIYTLYRTVVAHLEATVSAMRRAYIDPGASKMHGLKYNDLKKAVTADSEMRSFRYQGLVVPRDHAGAQLAIAGVKQLARDLIAGLAARFPKNRIMMALQVFDPRELPNSRVQWAVDAASYGRVLPKNVSQRGGTYDLLDPNFFHAARPHLRSFGPQFFFALRAAPTFDLLWTPIFFRAARGTCDFLDPKFFARCARTFSS